MSESSSLRNKIPLFDGSNFSNWRFRVESALDVKDLLKFIEDDLETLLGEVEDEDEAGKEALKKSEKQCKNIIVQSVHDSQLENIKGKTFAKDMIDTLASIYERKSIASQLILRRRLLTMKFNEVNDISDHFLEFDRTIRELISSGANLEDLDIVCHLLITLPNTYDALVTAIETMDQSLITLDFVKGRLIDEYNKRKGPDSKGKVIASAMQTNIVCYRVMRSVWSYKIAMQSQEQEKEGQRQEE